MFIACLQAFGELVEKEKTGYRQRCPHPFFFSQHIYYSAIKGKSQHRTIPDDIEKNIIHLWIRPRLNMCPKINFT